MPAICVAVLASVVPVSLRGQPVGPLAVIADLEEAWNAGDVDRVVEHLSAAPVQLSLARSGGVFSRRQAEFILRDWLAYRPAPMLRIIEMSWDWSEATKPADAVATARAVSWSSPDEWLEELEFEFAWQDDAWRIRRIQSLKRWRADGG